MSGLLTLPGEGQTVPWVTVPAWTRATAEHRANMLHCTAKTPGMHTQEVHI